MGLDGGTIPTRGELVQVKKKPEQVCYNYCMSIYLETIIVEQV